MVIAAVATGLAGAIHLSLTRQHFDEGLLFGVAFIGMGLYQVLLGCLLVVRPGPRAYQAGIWGSGLIIATYISTRVVPAPTATTPEEVTALGVAATTLELAALLLLVTALPDTAGRSWPIPAWLGGVVVGIATPVLWVFVTGAIQWTEPVPYPMPKLYWDPSRFGVLTPALIGYVTDRLYLFLPWWAAIGAVILGILAAGNVWLATQLRRERRISCRRRRASLLGLLPAAFAAPVCCAVPLAAIFGLSTATLFAGAPFATAAAVGLLAGNLVWLAQRRHNPARFDC